MSEKKIHPLTLAKWVATPGLLIGFMAVLLGLYESGLIMELTLSIGLGIMAASMMTFGFGLVLSLMDDKKRTAPAASRDPDGRNPV